jgi:hypothetical protein
LIVTYNELFAWNGKVSRWEGEQQEGWFHLPVFIFLDLAMVNGIGWGVILWSKLTSAYPSGLTKRFFAFFTTSRQVLFNRFLSVSVILGHVIFAIIFSEDGGRLYLWFNILTIAYVVLIFLITVPMSINLFLLIFQIRRQNRITNSEGSNNALPGLIRVFIIVLFSATLSPIAILDIIKSTVVKREDRIFRNLTPDEVNALGDGMYSGYAIGAPILVYSLFASILSIPFLFRKEFLSVLGCGRDSSDRDGAGGTLVTGEGQ